MARPRKQEYREPEHRCRGVVYVRDTYRRCGGKLHFKMHYSRGRCRRAATNGDFCWQHKPGGPASGTGEP